jgi:hypothetical protein
VTIGRAAVAIAAITLFTGVPAIAPADQATPVPVIVTDIEAQGTTEGTGPGFLSLTFENTSKAAVTEVVFEVSTGTFYRRLDDVGKFAPGVSITHAFLGGAGSAGFSIRDVRVAEVDFADGTAWTNGQAAAPRPRTQFPL